MQTIIYFNGGAKVRVEGTAEDVKRELNDSPMAEFTDTKGNRIHVVRESVSFWREKKP